MIVPIVEGAGDVRAVPVLLRRILAHQGLADLDIGQPIRRPRHQLVKPGQIEFWVRHAADLPGCLAVLILVDADDDCIDRMAPLGPDLRRRAGSVVRGVPVYVVLANREFEAWFLAGLEALRGRRGLREDAVAPPDPEQIRGAKERLSSYMPRTRPYAETADQPAFSQLFDLGLAHERSRSFRKLWKDIADLAIRLGAPPATVPPPHA